MQGARSRPPAWVATTPTSCLAPIGILLAYYWHTAEAWVATAPTSCVSYWHSQDDNHDSLPQIIILPDRLTCVGERNSTRKTLDKGMLAISFFTYIDVGIFIRTEKLADE